jgi:hypothetical protein
MSPCLVRFVGSHRAYGIAVGTGARREIIRAADERCEGNLESLDFSDIGEHPASSRQRGKKREEISLKQRRKKNKHNSTFLPEILFRFFLFLFFPCSLFKN